MIDQTKNPYQIIKNPRESLMREEKPNKGLRARLAGAALASTVAVVSWAGQGETPDQTPLNPEVTTSVVAEEGDSLLGLQQEEGLNGMRVDEAGHNLSELNGGSEIYPGQKVTLMDNVDNNPQVEE